MAFVLFFQARAQQEPTAARHIFETNCAACHGPGGAGGERAPALNGNPDLRKLSAADIENIIREGTSGGMPAFSSLPASDVAALAGWIHSMNLPALATVAPEKLAAGERFFFGEGGCSTCHMVHGRGAINGPDLTNIAARSTMAEIEKVLDDPTSQMGVHSLAVCPPWAFCPDFSWAVVDVTLKNGSVLRGFARKRTEHELQLQSFDGKLHLLDAGEYTQVRQEKESSMPPLKATPAQRQDLLAYLSSLGGIEAGPVIGPAPPVSQADMDTVLKPGSGEWPTYNGLLNGNRYSSLDADKHLQCATTAAPIHLLAGWNRSAGHTSRGGRRDVRDRRLANLCPQRTHRQFHMVHPAHQRARSGDQKSQAKTSTPKGPNRGVALLGDRVFYVSDDAFLVCLNRLTGAVMWSQPLPEAGAIGEVLQQQRTAGGRRPGDLRGRGRRRTDARFPRGVPCHNRRACLALLHHPQTRRAWSGDLDRPRFAHRRRRHLGYWFLRC